MQTQSPIRQWITLSPTDWELVSRARLNLLLVGGHDATSRAIRALVPALQGPVSSVRAGEGLTLPPPGHSGWLVLTDVSELPLREQHRLIVWLNQNDRRARVISTSRILMTGKIESGQFLPALYYRLNTVYIDLKDIAVPATAFLREA